MANDHRGVLGPLGTLYKTMGFSFRFSGFGFRVSGFIFRVSGFGFRVSGFGFRVSGFGFEGESYWASTAAVMSTPSHPAAALHTKETLHE